MISCEKEIDNTADSNTHQNHNHTHVYIETNGFPKMKIPDNNPLSEEGIELGRKLFYDKILSGDNTISCASCHFQSAGFSDPNQFSSGFNNQIGNRNASALINVGWLRSLFWDGRSENLEEQANDPITNPIEMNESWPNLLSELNSHTEYPNLFKVVFGGSKITSEMVLQALAQFERTLISDNSKYDQKIRGEIELTALEEAGFNLFFSEKAECFHCHGTILFTDDEFHNNGLDEFPSDLGLEEISGKVTDRGLFKTPTLRNIEFTAPYMHDGRFQTLEEVVDFYSDSVKGSPTVDPLMPNNNGGFRLTSVEKRQLVAFLKILSDTSFINNPKFKDPN